MVLTCTAIPDTDSIHTLLPIEELEQFCEIDSVRLGAWKHEGTFEKAKFVRQKCYLEQFYFPKKYKGKHIKFFKNLKKNCKNKRNIKLNSFRKIEITCAGMPKSCYDFVEWEKFKTGFTCGGKLTFKHVKGGVKLVETDFTIKEEKAKSSIANFKK